MTAQFLGQETLFDCVPTGRGLALHGDCDVSTAAQLARALERMHDFRRPLEIDLSRVTFADTSGLDPLFVEGARRRDDSRPALRLVRPGVAVRRVLDALGVSYDPLDLERWAAAKEYLRVIDTS